MSLKPDDLRAAVSAGLITEIQAASLSKLADERRGYRAASAQIDEPFELLKGFNEIFIVVGLLAIIAATYVIHITATRELKKQMAAQRVD